MGKLYWNTDRTQKISSINMKKLYEKFVSEVIGMKYSDLKDKCDEIYDKGVNANYFGQLSTPLNFLGLLQTKNEEGHIIVEKNDFLHRNILDDKFSELYTDYYLSYWQYPRHNNNDDRSLPIRKPYLLILKLLKLLDLRSPSEAYLTRNEFFYLFENNVQPYKTYDDINDALVSQILNNNRSWGQSLTDISLGDISYDNNLLDNSSLLSFDFDDYDDEYFCFGLSKKPFIKEKVNFILSGYIRDDIFLFDASVSYMDKSVKSEWAKFINNSDRFEKWFNGISIYNFEEYCIHHGFKFESSLIRRFILSLSTKPFLILTTLSINGYFSSR